MTDSRPISDARHSAYAQQPSILAPGRPPATEGANMIRDVSVTAKAPWLVPWPLRESRASARSKQRDPAEQAAALGRSEAQYRLVRDTTEASFWMNGGRYV